MGPPGEVLRKPVRPTCDWVSRVRVESLEKPLLRYQTIATRHSPLIGRVGVSPPSRYAGADFYIYSSGYEAFLVPAGPHATGKHKAGLITSSYLVKRGERANGVS